MIEKKENLEGALNSLECKKEYVKTEKLQKTLKLIKDSIKTANRVLEKKEINENEINTVKIDAQTLIEDM